MADPITVGGLLLAGSGAIASALVTVIKEWVGRTRNQNITITIETNEGTKTIVAPLGTNSKQLSEMLADALKPTPGDLTKKG